MEKWLDPQTIAIWIVVVLAIIMLLAFSFVKLVRLNFKRMVENQLKESRLKLEYQQKLLETGIVAQEQERTRIAADLHDSIIGKLTILRLKNQAGTPTEQIDLLLGESIDEARRISHDLSPPLLEFVSLEALLESILLPWKKYFTIDLYRNTASLEVINEALKIQMARIVQELVINIHKHAEASDIKVQLKITNRYLALIVADNGKGFEPSRERNGIGLKNIELRMLYLKGVHKIKSGKKGSTAIIVVKHQTVA